MDNNDFSSNVGDKEMIDALLSRKRASSRKTYIIMLIVAIIAVVVSGFAIRFVYMTPARQFEFDDNAKPILEMNDEQLGLRSQLQESADKSNLAIQIYSKPEFENANSEGLLYILNSAENQFELQVEILLDATGESVYKSPVLKPGGSIQKDKLSAPLEKGEYPATAIFTATDPESGAVAGRAGAALTITILN